MNNAFKVLKTNKLNIKDEIIYSLLCCYSDSKGVSDISRECLARKAGIKKLDTITTHTNKLEEMGLIKKTYTTQGGKKLAHYQVINPQKDFMWVANEITQYKPCLMGFLIKLAALR